MPRQLSLPCPSVSRLRVKRLGLLVAATLASNAAWAQVVIHSDGSVSKTGIIATGSQSVEKTGVGTYFLHTDQTYTGGTTIRAGTLQLGDGGATSASLKGNIVNYGTLAVANAYGATYDGDISGTGALVKTGRGTATLTGNNSYTGGTTVSFGTLSIGDGVRTGSLASDVLVNSGGTLTFNGAADSNTVWNNTISGTGTVVKAGAGTLTLTGKQTLTGNLAINGGVVAIGASGGSTGELASNIIGSGNAQLVFNRSGDTAFNGSIVQTGLQLTKNGAGALTFTNTVQGGLLVINEGSVIANGAMLVRGISGSGNVVVDQSGRLTFNNVASLTTATDIDNKGIVQFNTFTTSIFSGTLSGSGAVQNTAGTNVITGNNSYTGGTTLSSGILQVGSAGALGTSGAITFNGGTLRFSVANTIDYSERIKLAGRMSIDTNGQAVTFGTGLSGGASAGLTKAGTGTLTLDSNNTYLGTTNVSAGKLAIGNGGTSGSLASSGVTIGTGATLEFNRSNDSAYAGVISGTGTLVKQGDGMLQLGAINSFTGKTEVLDGELRSAGLASSAVRVAVGAVLTGNDRVGALNVEGLLNAAAGIGKLTATSATFAAGSIFRWELGDAAGAAGTGYDTFATSGAITFAAGAAKKTIQLALPGVDGKLLNFDTGLDHSFTLMSATGGLRSLDLAAFDIDASGLGLDSRRGRWTLTNTANVLSLNYIATLIEEGDVPEPATALIFLTGLAGVGASLRRRGARQAA